MKFSPVFKKRVNNNRIHIPVEEILKYLRNLNLRGDKIMSDLKIHTSPGKFTFEARLIVKYCNNIYIFAMIYLSLKILIYLLKFGGINKLYNILL